MSINRDTLDTLMNSTLTNMEIAEFLALVSDRYKTSSFSVKFRDMVIEAQEEKDFDRILELAKDPIFYELDYEGLTDDEISVMEKTRKHDVERIFSIINSGSVEDVEQSVCIAKGSIINIPSTYMGVVAVQCFDLRDIMDILESYENGETPLNPATSKPFSDEILKMLRDKFKLELKLLKY